MSNVDNKNSNGIPTNNIGLLMDVTINVTVELGRARLSIKEILSLGEGSIIELQKLAGEPVDLLVNGKLIAKGEVVVIDECFGVRVTDIVDSVYNTVAADLIHDEYISRRKIILSQKRALAFKFLCAYVKRNTLQKKGRNVKLKCTYNNKWNYKLAWYLAHKNQQYSLKHPDKIEKIPLSIVYVYMLFIRFLLSF